MHHEKEIASLLALLKCVEGGANWRRKQISYVDKLLQNIVEVKPCMVNRECWYDCEQKLRRSAGLHKLVNELREFSS